MATCALQFNVMLPMSFHCEDNEDRAQENVEGRLQSLAVHFVLPQLLFAIQTDKHKLIA